MDCICPAIYPSPRSSSHTHTHTHERVQSTCPKSLVLTKFRLGSFSQPCPGASTRGFLSIASAVLVSQGQQLMVCGGDTSFMLHALRAPWLHRLQCGYMRCTHARTRYQMQSVMVLACSAINLISSLSPSATLNAFFFSPGVIARKHSIHFSAIFQLHM